MPSRRANYNRRDHVVLALIFLVGSSALHAAESNDAAKTALTIPTSVALPPAANSTAAAAAIVQAESAFTSGDKLSAETILNAALAKDPNSIPLLVARGTVALAAGDLPSASFCHRRAAALESRNEFEPSLAVHQLGEQLAMAVADRHATRPASRWAQLPGDVTAPLAPQPSPRLALPSSPAPTNAATTAPLAIIPTPSRTALVVSAIPSLASLASPSTDTASPPESFPGRVVPNPNSDAALQKDPAGQWASAAKASSTYSARYSAEQATGAPNVFIAGNAPEAWAPAQSGPGTAWLEVSFTRVSRAQSVRVRQNSAPGCITRIEAIDASGETHLWWAGKDPYTPPRTPEIAWFVIQLPATDYAVAKIRLTFDLGAVPGWKQIDAVQLVSANP